MPHFKSTTALGLIAALGLAACGKGDEASVADAAPTLAEAQGFMKDAESQLYAMSEYAARVAWVNANFITEDTDWLASRSGAEFTELAVKLANETKKYQDLDLPPDLARKMAMLKAGITLPAPDTPGAAQELSDIATRLQSTYGKGKGRYKGEVKPGNELEALMGTERDPAALEEMWTSWREISLPMKPDYVRMVEIANAGARELGYADLGQMWRSNYDMDPDEFAALTDKLWAQVKPLYDQLHCYARAKLGDYYGTRLVPQDGPIPAHLLGNMWAQQWGNIYPLVAPKTSGPGYDLTELLVKAGYDPVKMVKTGEGFFTSLGFAPLPETFWERSLITKPRDREVVCHASAWDLDNKNDVRIKMCTLVNADDFETIHHELGHNFYQRAYQNQDPLYLTGANDGFHEAIGDMVALSITPEYLVQIGLLSRDKMPSADADIGLLLARALDKVAFLPFGLLVDKWRWQVFAGEVTPENYNAAWWALRTQYQGITPPVARSEADFDPGAKFHIPGNTPYMRYFLAHILQFQFQKAACEAAGWEGPLHRCSIYGNKAVGEKFNAMLEMGASKPWPEALAAFTGSREMDGAAIIAYFQPLMTWLENENKNRQCGW
ncbi:MAG: M2 family metallopeptidase [Pseudomonadota bacterium]